MPTDVLTARPGDLAADFYVWGPRILALCLDPTIRTHPAAKTKGKVVGVCSYLGDKNSGGKTTKRAHTDNMAEHRIGWAPILEIGSADSDKGAAKGVAHAKLAIKYMEQQWPDAPAGLTITAASDTNTDDRDVGANRDYHAAFGDHLATQSPWRARCYGDYETCEVVPADRVCTLPGASAWSERWFTAVKRIPRAERGNAAKILAATRKAGLRDIDMLQQSDTGTASALVDWLFIYTDRVQFWLPGAGDGPSRPPHPDVVTTRYGDTGIEVAKLQAALHKIFPPLVVDGKFGRQTRKFVKAFQRFNGLKVDGIAGPRTWAAIKTWGLA